MSNSQPRQSRSPQRNPTPSALAKADVARRLSTIRARLEAGTPCNLNIPTPAQVVKPSHLNEDDARIYRRIYIWKFRDDLDELLQERNRHSATAIPSSSSPSLTRSPPSRASYNYTRASSAVQALHPPSTSCHRRIPRSVSEHAQVDAVRDARQELANARRDGRNPNLLHSARLITVSASLPTSQRVIYRTAYFLRYNNEIV